MRTRSTTCTRPRPPREEWDFSPEFLPDCELADCLHYEESRLRPWKRDLDYVSNLRKQAARNCFDEYRALAAADKRPREEFSPMWYWLWPEWPDKPYLSVPPVERKRRLKLQALPFASISLSEFNLNEYIKHRVSHAITKERAKDPGPLGAFCAKLIKALPNHPLPLPKDVVALHLPAHESDESLISGFKCFLKERHQRTGTVPVERRGANSPRRQMRSTLKRLGAYRLLSSGMSWEEAFQHTAATSGRPLYSYHAHVWRNAILEARAEFCLRPIPLP